MGNRLRHVDEPPSRPRQVQRQQFFFPTDAERRMKPTDLKVGRSADDCGAGEETEHGSTRPPGCARQRAVPHQAAGRVLALPGPDQDSAGDQREITVPLE